MPWLRYNLPAGNSEMPLRPTEETSRTRPASGIHATTLQITTLETSQNCTSSMQWPQLFLTSLAADSNDLCGWLYLHYFTRSTSTQSHSHCTATITPLFPVSLLPKTTPFGTERNPQRGRTENSLLRHGHLPALVHVPPAGCVFQKSATQLATIRRQTNININYKIRHLQDVEHPSELCHIPPCSL